VAPVEEEPWLEPLVRLREAEYLGKDSTVEPAAVKLLAPLVVVAQGALEKAQQQRQKQEMAASVLQLILLGALQHQLVKTSAALIIMLAAAAAGGSTLDLKVLEEEEV
jgi:hypothetical protein